MESVSSAPVSTEQVVLMTCVELPAVAVPVQPQPIVLRVTPATVEYVNSLLVSREMLPAQQTAAPSSTQRL